MNEAINAALKQIEAARKPASAVPWEPDLPYAQNIYTFDYPTQQWKAAAGPNPARSQPDAQAASGPLISRLALFSWNIDFMLPHGRSRMLAALEELRTRVAALPAETAAVVFLQECVADDLDVIGAQAWVRAGFARTDVDTAAWASGLYGTTTLVDKRLDVRGVFRIHYALTRMERDALFVDVVFPSQHRAITEILEKRDDGKSGEKGKENEKIIRLCNTHLESLAQDPPYRPPQAALAARFMREESVWGALRTCRIYLPFFLTSYHLSSEFLSLPLPLSSHHYTLQTPASEHSFHPTLRPHWSLPTALCH